MRCATKKPNIVHHICALYSHTNQQWLWPYQSSGHMLCTTLPAPATRLMQNYNPSTHRHQQRAPYQHMCAAQHNGLQAPRGTPCPLTTTSPSPLLLALIPHEQRQPLRLHLSQHVIPLLLLTPRRRCITSTSRSSRCHCCCSRRGRESRTGWGRSGGSGRWWGW